MKRITTIFLFLMSGIFTFAQSDKNIMQGKINLEQLKETLVSDNSWIPYPDYKDRASWDRLSPEAKQYAIAQGEKSLSYHWEPFLATDYLAYVRNGKIFSHFSRFGTLSKLAIAELVEGKGRFMDAIINGVWFMCESSWVHSAHTCYQRDKSGLPDPDEPIIELTVGDIGAEMAWIYYFFHEEFDKVSPIISKRIKDNVFKRMINPYFARNDYWWKGFNNNPVNNWNIWINYNVLQAVMLLENDQDKKAEEVWHIIRSADNYINSQYDDGACEEGPSYFGHAGANLIKFLDIIKRATNGMLDIYNVEKIKNIGRYIYRVNIHNDYFVNFSDANIRSGVDPGAVYFYGKCIKDGALMGYASNYAKNTNWIGHIYGGSVFANWLDNIFLAKEVMGNADFLVDELSFYFPNGELATARDDKQTDKGFFFACHGSNNGVSHNHNDVGSFMMFYNGKPVLIDVGVEAYTDKTFSKDRYKIWTMRSVYHNLPTVNGFEQHNGKKYCARNTEFKDTGKNVFFKTDITKAYPIEAGINKWIRSYTLQRNKCFKICDKWDLESFKEHNVLNFMTNCKVTISDGCILLDNGSFAMEMTFNPRIMGANVETIELNDKNLKSAWKQDRLYRIQLTQKDKSLKGKSEITIRKKL